MRLSRFLVWKDRIQALTLTPTDRRSWWVIVTVMSVAAFLVAAFVSPQLMAAKILPDFLAAYHPGAVGIQNGTGYLDPSGEFITKWPPGWSIFISPWVVESPADSVGRLRIVSGFLAAAWVVVVACLCRFLLPRIAVLVPLGITVFWPPMWAIGNPMLSELLFAFLSAIAVFVLAHLYRLRLPSLFATVALTSAAWFVLAASALAKTTGLAVAGAMFIGIAFGFHSWSVKRRTAVLLLSALVFAIGLAPWVLKFKEHAGYYGFTDNGFISVRDGLVRFPHFPVGLELQERSPQWQTNGDIWADVRDVAAADPFGALHLLGIKIVCPWYATWTGRFDRYLFVVQFPWFLLFVLASARALVRWKRIPGPVILLHGYVAALWFAAALVAPILRYLLPGFPFVVIVVLWHALDAGLLRQNAGEPGKSAGESSFE